MSELRIGTANSEPAIGTLKVGSADIQEIYLGSSKIWPTVSPGLDDPYVPIADNTDPRFIGTEPVNSSSNSPAYVRIYDESANIISTLGTIATPSTAPSIAGAYYCISTASDNCDYLWARTYSTNLLYGYIIRSNDRGATWVETSIRGYRQSGDPVFTPSIEQSRDGKYVVIIPSAPFTTPLISSDYGVNFSSIAGLLSFDKQYAAAGMSAGGKYIYLTYVPSGASIVQVYRSDDYGQTFSNITTSVNLQATIPGYVSVFSYKPLVNATGSKVVFAFTNRAYTANKFGNISSISTDYGVTYSKISQQMFGYRLYDSPAVSRNATADGSRYMWNAGQSARYWSWYDSSLATSLLQDIGTNAEQSMTSVSNYGSYGIAAAKKGITTTTEMRFNSWNNTAGYTAVSIASSQHAADKMQLAVNVL